MQVSAYKFIVVFLTMLAPLLRRIQKDYAYWGQVLHDLIIKVGGTRQWGRPMVLMISVRDLSPAVFLTFDTK